MGRSDRRSRSRSRSRSRERRRRRDRGAEKAPRSDERGGAPAPAPASAAAPKVSARVDYAAVRDSLNLKSGGDGEVSLTVDDSNALRARLGLRPLNDDKSSSAAEAQAVAERNFKLARAAQQEARRLSAIEAELARAKRRREASAVLPGPRLGDGDGDDEEAADWVARSRAAAKTKSADLARLEAERRSQLLFEQETSSYTAADLAGLSVAAHSADALNRGDAMILTLADEEILHYDDAKHGKLVGLAAQDGAPVLENVNRAEDDARVRGFRDRRDEALLQAGGAALDDAEFEGGGLSTASVGTLGKYDARGRPGASLRIGAAGALAAADQTHLTGAAIAHLAERIGDGRGGAAFEADGGATSLRTGAWKAEAVDAGSCGFVARRDYLTADEAAALFKKKRKKKGAGGSRKALPAAATPSVLDGLDDAGDDAAGDRGSRGAAVGARGDGGAAAADRARRANYDRAQANARERVAVGLGQKAAEPAVSVPTTLSNNAAAAPPRATSKFVAGLGDDDDDCDLAASLARARALAASATVSGEDGAAAVAARVKAEVKADVEESDGLVFTSTTEFTARLHARLEERAAENAEAQRAAEALANAAPMETDALPPDDSDSDSDSDSDASAAAAEAEKRGELVDFIHKQPLARDGMAATMGLLRQTGDVQIKHVEQKVGRARDQTIFEDGTEDDAAVAAIDGEMRFKAIKLEYRDADGRLLTRREAFRQMCHKFHGKGPGKKKTEKFASREIERQRSIKMNAAAGSLSILQHAQARTGQAYVPINNQSAYAAMGQDPKAASKKKKKKKAARQAARAGGLG